MFGASAAASSAHHRRRRRGRAAPGTRVDQLGDVCEVAPARSRQYRPQMSAEKAPPSGLRRAPLWLWIVLIAIGGALAAAGAAMAASHTSGAWSDLWSEVAKAGVQVVAVGAVGGALTATWKAIADRRETAAATKVKLRAEFLELVALYNDVKAVRRALRSLGLDAKLNLDRDMYAANETEDKNYFSTEDGLKELKAVGLAVRLSQEQADGFRKQMRILNRLQLGYEAKKRQFKQADLLGEDRAAVVATLEFIESYLNGLVGLWEEHGWTFQEGTVLDEVSPGLQRLFRKEPFRAAVSNPMEGITAVFNEHLFGATVETDYAKRFLHGSTPEKGSRPSPRSRFRTRPS